MKQLKSTKEFWKEPKKNSEIKYLFLILVIAFLLFYQSLFNFYTHDDFFLLKISNANNISDFVNFFNLIKGPEGLGMYRPLAMQSFFMLAWKLFNLNPLGLHIISFIFFFTIILLVYLLTIKLTGDKRVGLFASFLYAVSSTHFAHLFWLSDFQELAVTLFFLISVIFFIKYLKENMIQTFLLSLIFFILSLLSKETAIILPLVYILIYVYLRSINIKVIDIRKFLLHLIPFIIILLLYFYFRSNYYGFPKGVSYIWDFSPRVINTLFWYGFWSFNLPEMLVDFVGSGLKINLNPLLFWKNYLVIIISSVFILFTILTLKIVEFTRKLRKADYSLLIFGIFWFIMTLLPVLFLPWHKFAYYLTLPLIGIVILISNLIFTGKHIKEFIVIFSIFWLISSITNIRLSIRSSWITKGSETAKNVYSYLEINYRDLKEKRLVFYDTPEDELHNPWYPSETLKTVLSDNNFFAVFFPEVNAVYLRGKKADNNQNIIELPANEFVVY